MIEIRIDDSSLKSALQSLAARLSDMRPALRSAAAVLRDEAMQSFDDQRSPEGMRWPRLKAASIIARARRRAPKGYAKNRARTLARFADAKALLDTGQLRNSLRVQRVTNSEAVMGTRLPYAAVHQFGGKAGRGRKVMIPARPFLGLSERGQSDILGILRRHLEAGA